jgi:hypothetical protein
MCYSSSEMKPVSLSLIKNPTARSRSISLSSQIILPWKINVSDHSVIFLIENLSNIHNKILPRPAYFLDYEFRG